MKSVHFGFGLDMGAGQTPSVGLNRRGNVVVVHEAANGTKLYRVGRLSDATIRWAGDRSKPGGSGETPRVALNNHDIAVEVHRNPGHKKLYCRAGRLNDAVDDVTWPHARGYAEGNNRSRPAVALNDAGVVVEEHEVWEGNRVWLHFSVGQVEDAGGELFVKWSPHRERGAEAAMPSIAINNSGTVVEVHRYPYGSKDRRVFYTIGQVNKTTMRINFETRREIVLPNGVRANGYYPSVALTDDGLVIVLLRARTKVEVLELVGRVSSNRKSVDWNRWWYYDDGTRPTVAAAGNMAVEIHQHEKTPALRFSTSIITDRSRWMQNRLATLGAKSLRDLVLPASHDAGSYTENLNRWARNQNLSIYDQLHYGIRYFDLRPMRAGTVSEGDWYIHHGRYTGPKLRTVLADIRKFVTEEGRKELIILKFSHFESITARNYPQMVKMIVDALGPWLVKSRSDDKRFSDVPLREYVEKGPAILLVVDNDLATEFPREGFLIFRNWNAGDAGDLCVHDVWSNMEDFADMRDHQISAFLAYDGMMENKVKRCDLFLLSWILSPKMRIIPLPPSLWLLARRANPHLGNHIRSLRDHRPPWHPNFYRKIINLLYVDFVQSARVTDIALFLNGERVFAAEPAPPRRAKRRGSPAG